LPNNLSEAQSSGLSGTLAKRWFDCNPPTQDHGFIRVDKNRRYFVFEDGTSFIPIGLNKFAIYQESDQEIDSMFAKWSDHGINYLRIWVGIGADPEITVGTFDTERMRKLDFIVRRSAEYGIYLSICFWNENSLRGGNGEWGWDGQQQIYNLANSSSGTTNNADDLKDVTHAASFRATKERYTYFVNRWKNEPAVMMWDLVNDSKKSETWKSQMYDLVRKIDEHRHIITFQYNTGIDPGGEMDCGSVRVYNYNPKGNNPEQMMSSLADRIRNALVHGDPVYCGEGRMNYEAGSSYVLERGFLHFLWGPIAVGAAGNLHSWVSINSSEDTWPDLTEQELDWIKGYTKFCKTIQWSEFNSRNVDDELKVEMPQVKAFACRNNNTMLIYLMNDDPAQNFGPIKTQMTISSELEVGTYQLQWIDIRSGQIVKKEKIHDFPGLIKVPKFNDGIFAVIKCVDCD
jgi:hypothetical protein